MFQQQNQLARTQIRCEKILQDRKRDAWFVTNFGNAAVAGIEIPASASRFCEWIILAIIFTNRSAKFAISASATKRFDPTMFIGWNSLLRDLAANPIGF